MELTSSTTAAGLLERARCGDQQAWNEIVDSYSGLLYAVVRGFRLGDAQSNDAVQTTWLRLVEHLGDIRDPARLHGWLRTTASRVCLEHLRHGRRETTVETLPEVDVLGPDPDADGPDASTLRQERVALVRTVLAGLSDRDRALVQLLVSPESPSYEQISARLGMPIGSIGPTRQRVLHRLRLALEAAGFTDVALV